MGGIREIILDGTESIFSGTYHRADYRLRMAQANNLFISGIPRFVTETFGVIFAVQADLLAAVTNSELSGSQVYNIDVGELKTLIDLFNCIKEELKVFGVAGAESTILRDFRSGDVMHSLADVVKIRSELGYLPLDGIQSGITKTLPWYIDAGKVD
jgi:UDP-N-acetylglucosamine 4-epimerase